MSSKKILLPIARGVASVAASVLALSTLGYGVAQVWRGTIDAALGTESFEIVKEGETEIFPKEFKSEEEFVKAMKEHAVQQGREGAVVMKNKDNALPISANATVALFGINSYSQYYGVAAGNSDRVNLESALTAQGLKIDGTVKNIYANIDGLVSEQEVTDSSGNTSIKKVKDYALVTSPGDWTNYKISECDPAKFVELGVAEENWKSQVTKGAIGIVTFARGAGEGGTFKPGSALDSQGNPTGKDPLTLSDEELSVVDAAKEVCDKVIVLLNSGNTLGIKEIAEGGAHEVDGIVYIGALNDYQLSGIAEVLVGKVNATGALPETYMADFNSLPAMQNFGGDYFVDYETVGTASGYTDPRWGAGTEIANTMAGSFGGSATYNGGFFIVEAEGIYGGYNYYETRYYDSIVNSASKANSTKGSTTGSAWNYNDEIVYSFGHGLSYYEYEQKIVALNVDRSTTGNITATVEVTNKSNTKGNFLAQLYVQQPYTQYDKDNKVEKSAIMFLNSAKVEVGANSSETVEISLPTKYLASYDYTSAKTYILDAGDYYFTAAAGAHEAVNNVLKAQGQSVDAKGECKVWSLGSLDSTTFSTDHGKEVTNAFDNADLNYWLEDSVTYLSRSDWDATWPKNYNEQGLKIKDSKKVDEWLTEMRGQQRMLKDTGKALESNDRGVKFSIEFINESVRNNIDDPYWDQLAGEITIDQAVGAVIHGGSWSDQLDVIDNPAVQQHEGVNGISATLSWGTDDNKQSFKTNISSQTLLGSSFNPALARRWGELQGESGLWLQKYSVWGTGLTIRRTPHNGRNYEYISEDAMLANRIGYGILGGTADKGLACGPKHMGFNDQEHNRSGISVYMHGQRIRETDLRAFQGGLSEGGGLAVMVAFNRIGATNASHSVAMLKTVLREEWGFKYLISTDMMNNAYYFYPEPMIMATVTQVADFARDNSTISGSDGHDATWAWISPESVANDSELVEQARENLKYQLYAFANTGLINIKTVPVTPYWETAIQAAIGVSAALTVIAGIGWAVLVVLGQKKKDN